MPAAKTLKTLPARQLPGAGLWHLFLLLCSPDHLLPAIATAGHGLLGAHRGHPE
jgi:hypothetical protein